MLDIKFIRENAEILKKSIVDKNIKLDLGELLALDKRRSELISEVEEFKSMKNSVNDLIKSAKTDKERKEIIEKGKEIKIKTEEKEPELKKIQQEFNELMVKVPNVISADTPIGKDDSENVEIEKAEPLKEELRFFLSSIQDGSRLGRPDEAARDALEFALKIVSSIEQSPGKMLAF